MFCVSGHHSYLKVQYSWNSPHLESLQCVIQVWSTDLNESFGLPGSFLSWESKPNLHINKGRSGTNHGQFRQSKTFKTVVDCQVSYSQWVSQSVSKSVSKSVHQSISQSFSQSVSQSVSQSIMINSWESHEKVMIKSWASHEQVMNKS